MWEDDKVSLRDVHVKLSRLGRFLFLGNQPISTITCPVASNSSHSGTPSPLVAEMRITCRAGLMRRAYSMATLAGVDLDGWRTGSTDARRSFDNL